METITLPRGAVRALACYAKGEIDFMEAKKRSGLAYGEWTELVAEAGLPGITGDWTDEDWQEELDASEALGRALRRET